MPQSYNSITYYDPRQADEAARLSRLLFDGRFYYLIRLLISYICWNIAFTFSAATKPTTRSQRRRSRAIRLRVLLIDLGAAYIKLGQFLSVRKDVLSAELAEELALLQDRVPPFSLKLVRETINADLGAQPEQLFSSFELQPIASASIGQVHRVQLHDGTEAVIKVQRPDLAENFLRDLGLLRWWAKLMSVLRIEQKKGSWLELSNEFGRTLFAETNYIAEGRNADRFRHIMREHDKVKIPRVYWKYTGRRVIALEYLPGTKIDQVDDVIRRGVIPASIGTILIETYLEQVLFNGFFHADPHAGNLAVDDQGNLIMYDFGMVGEITSEQRKALGAAMICIMNRDPKGVVANLIKLGVVHPSCSQELLTRILEPLFEYYRGTNFKDLGFDHLEKDIEQLASQRAFQIPSTLAYLLRAGSSVEGVARMLQSDFSFVQPARAFLKKAAAQGRLNLVETFATDILSRYQGRPVT
jgi:predicted unusual protein kinase regulating ubiquinone biosynthesis (AarF/ABC1/UbiB family)